ncbi:MAG: AraC family transcriptional regulator [Hyphomicrobium sp.]|jgi:AraC-like DNA-binding protein
MADPDRSERIVAGRLQRVVFTSEGLPRHLDDPTRFRLWRDQWNALYGAVDMARAPDQPFAVRFEFVPVGAVGVARFEGTLTRLARTANDVATNGSDHFSIGLHHGRASMLSIQRGRETVLGPDTAVLQTGAEPGEVRATAEMGSLAVNVSRRQLIELVGNAEDLIGAPLNPDSEVLRHVRRYLGILLGPGGITREAALIDHVSKTLLDLIALLLGAGRHSAELARVRGLRAARLQEALASITASFADPAFSSDELAKRMGFSRRYINDLLAETGSSFAERVLELRLQKARETLADPGSDRLKVSEIAFGCGFNDVSYFNRCFRRRFGASPTQYRGSTSV